MVEQETVFRPWNTQEHIALDTFDKCFAITPLSSAPWCIWCLYCLWQVECTIFFDTRAGLRFSRPLIFAWNEVIISAHVNVTFAACWPPCAWAIISSDAGEVPVKIKVCSSWKSLCHLSNCKVLVYECIFALVNFKIHYQTTGTGKNWYSTFNPVGVRFPGTNCCTGSVLMSTTKKRSDAQMACCGLLWIYCCSTS